MKIVTYNIRYALGMDGVYNYDRIADAVREADIIGLQEVERFWRRSDMVDQVEIIAKKLKGFYWSYCPAYDMDASVRDEDGSVLNRRRQFGTMLLSRWPIISSRAIILPKIATTQNLNMDTGALECVIDVPSGAVRAYSLHLSAVSLRERLMQIDHLLELHRNAQHRGGTWTGTGPLDDPSEYENFLNMDWSNGANPPPMPAKTIMMGDFNSLPDGAEYNRFVGEIDPPTQLRMPHSDSFVDSWAVAKEQIGEGAMTWWPDPPDRAPGYPVRLDYCFLSSDYSSKVKRAWVDQKASGSDHKPYWVELMN